MKLIRYRKPSLKTAMGVTRAKRSIARATGVPTTRSGRKRKALNTLTGGSYGKYQRTRAAINRPYNRVKHPASCMGCLIWAIGIPTLLCIAIIILL